MRKDVSFAIVEKIDSTVEKQIYFWQLFGHSQLTYIHLLLVGPVPRGGGPRLDHWARIQFGRVHFGEKNMKNQPGTMKTMKNHEKPTWNHEKP